MGLLQQHGLVGTLNAFFVTGIGAGLAFFVTYFAFILARDLVESLGTGLTGDLAGACQAFGVTLGTGVAIAVIATGTGLITGIAQFFLAGRAGQTLSV